MSKKFKCFVLVGCLTSFGNIMFGVNYLLQGKISGLATIFIGAPGVFILGNYIVDL